MTKFVKRFGVIISLVIIESCTIKFSYYIVNETKEPAYIIAVFDEATPQPKEFRKFLLKNKIVDFENIRIPEFKDSILANWDKTGIGVLKIPAYSTLYFGSGYNSSKPFLDHRLQYMIVASGQKIDTLYKTQIGKLRSLKNFKSASKRFIPSNNNFVYTISE